MDVSASYIHEKIASKDILPFILFAGVTLLFSLAGFFLNIPVIGLFSPFLLIAALLIKNPVGMFIALFATFSVAINISVFTADSAILLLMAGYWLINKSELGKAEKSFKWLRRMAWANLIW